MASEKFYLKETGGEPAKNSNNCTIQRTKNFWEFHNRIKKIF